MILAAQSSTPMKVLHVISSMSPEAGGPPAVCAGLADALVARGHEVTIATVEAAGSTRVPISSSVLIRGFPPSRAAGDRYVRSEQLDFWLRENVAAFDIVHLHSVWQFPTFSAARACWANSVPYVVLLNGMLDRYSVNQRSYWIKRAYWLWRESKIAKRAGGIHFLNQAEIHEAVPWLRDLPKFVIGNGVRQSEFRSLPARGAFRHKHPEFANRPLALFLSRIHPKKGLDRFIPAWKTVADRNPDARLIIAGAGDADYVQSIDRLIAEANLGSRVIRVGQLVGREKWEALVDADCFVLPSHQEGFSMAITEALAAGCPPVVTKECNFDELAGSVDDGIARSGIIVRDGDMQAMANVIAELLANPAERESLATAGKQLVASRYTWERIAMDMEDVYRWLIAGKNLPTDGRATWRSDANPVAAGAF